MPFKKIEIFILKGKRENVARPAEFPPLGGGGVDDEGEEEVGYLNLQEAQLLAQQQQQLHYQEEAADLQRYVNGTSNVNCKILLKQRHSNRD